MVITNKWLVLLILIVSITPSSSSPTPQQRVQSVIDQIHHVVVLMLENRSFDHMLGFLKQLDSRVDGCIPGAPGCMNSASDGTNVTVSDDAPYVSGGFPAHDCGSTLQQMYGAQGNRNARPAPMNGFVENYQHHCVTPKGCLGKEIMKGFKPSDLPTLSKLAQEYCLVDGWFASIPGPTFVNRMYALSGTSHGNANNNVLDIALGYPQKTIMEELDEHNVSWRNYFSDLPAMLTHSYPRKIENWKKFRFISQFEKDFSSGDAANFTWIEPRYFQLGNLVHATDQHPNHNVSLGDDLTAQIYNSIVKSPLWNNTMFLVMYDEHGGYFDHVSPPDAPNPDGLIDKTVPFNFTQLGVRVPMVAISPFVRRQTVVHRNTEPGAPQFDHTSLTKALRQWLLPSTSNPLTAREAWSRNLTEIFFRGSEPRELIETTLVGDTVNTNLASPRLNLHTTPHKVLAPAQEGEDDFMPDYFKQLRVETHRKTHKPLPPLVSPRTDIPVDLPIMNRHLQDALTSDSEVPTDDTFLDSLQTEILELARVFVGTRIGDECFESESNAAKCVMAARDVMFKHDEL